MINKTWIPIIVGAAALGLFVAERFFPLRKPSQKLGARLVANGLMSLMTYATAMLLVQPVAAGTLSWSSAQGFGLIRLLDAPSWIQIAMAFLLLDVTFYYWHRMNHRIPLLWRFHNVHHTDPDLDVSTGFRFHFGEVAFSTLFRGAQALLIGASFAMFAAYELVFQIGTFFHHSNLRLPAGLERILNFVLVTPRMHGIHHSNFQTETNSNYSVVFSWWDRLHRTFRRDIPQRDIRIGVPGYSDPTDNQLKRLVAMPFRKQRDYWQGRVSRRNN